MRGRDYELRWPVDVFRKQLVGLLNGRNTIGDWADRVDQLLQDAFVTGVPLAEYKARSTDRSLPDNPTSLTNAQKFLRDLLAEADQLPLLQSRKPYWSERLTGNGIEVLSTGAAAKDFFVIVDDLDTRGYFDRALGSDCVDDPRASQLDEWLVRETQRSRAVILQEAANGNPDPLVDAMEATHDITALPLRGWYHQYCNCGWHALEWATEAGQQIFRWHVNRILARTELGLHLAEEGEDIGRAIYGTDDARNALLARMSAREGTSMIDEVGHAVALFRGRDADVTMKRSAIVALAGVLENRRELLKTTLLRKDEGALFELANEFDLRHRKPGQRADYDEAFLDWIFYWYLATVELTDRILARPQPG